MRYFKTLVERFLIAMAVASIAGMLTEMFSPVAIPFVVIFIPALYMWWDSVRREWEQERRMGDIVKRLVSQCADGDVDSGYRMGILGVQEDWFEMVGAYHKYVQSLSMQKRHEIVDKLLQNQQRKCDGDTDLATLISKMSHPEVEAMVFMIGEGPMPQSAKRLGMTYTSVSYAEHTANELADEVISFRFRNPY